MTEEQEFWIDLEIKERKEYRHIHSQYDEEHREKCKEVLDAIYIDSDLRV